MADEVVTFETVLKAAKSTGEITYDFNYEIEQDDERISEEFQKKQDEEWCRKAGVVALQTQLQELIKVLTSESEQQTRWLQDEETKSERRVSVLYARIVVYQLCIKHLKGLLGCVEAKR